MNVVVSVATAFVKGGYSVDQLIEGWQKQGATIGMREYYSIIHWDKDLPGSARAGRPTYMNNTIPDFHAKGAGAACHGFPNIPHTDHAESNGELVGDDVGSGVRHGDPEQQSKEDRHGQRLPCRPVPHRRRQPDERGRQVQCVERPEWHRHRFTRPAQNRGSEQHEVDGLEPIVLDDPATDIALALACIAGK